jgi:hypothetical protein
VCWPDRCADCCLQDDRTIGSEEAVYIESLKQDLEGVLSGLSDRDAGVLRMRFGLLDGREYTLDEVGAEFKVRLGRTRLRWANAVGAAIVLQEPCRGGWAQTHLNVCAIGLRGAGGGLVGCRGCMPTCPRCSCCHAEMGDVLGSVGWLGCMACTGRKMTSPTLVSFWALTCMLCCAVGHS